jgi:3-oxoacyl-[acyl-carrier protein] reductase
MIDPGLEGKVVLVTGGNNPLGIGAATVKAFASQGAKVFIHYYRQQLHSNSNYTKEDQTNTPGEEYYKALQQHSGEEIAQEIQSTGGHAVAWEADLSNPDVIPMIFDQTEKIFGPADVLVNNAAISNPDIFIPESELGPNSRAVDDFPMRTISTSMHDQHFSVNSWAVALLMAEFARRFIDRHASDGHIVNISTDGASGFSSEASYGASKHAMESYSRATAKEFGRFGINVNILSLGPVQTGWITSEIEERESLRCPLGRVGTPEEIADVIVFLASTQARWLTGQLIYVGGGTTMSL